MYSAKAEYAFSGWASITFIFENPNDPASIARLSLANDTGMPGDNITEDPTLIGTIQNDGHI